MKVVKIIGGKAEFIRDDPTLPKPIKCVLTVLEKAGPPPREENETDEEYESRLTEDVMIAAKMLYNYPEENNE